jgi:2-amino-4-hydroxy-6-hydroxymethyldihydropteridine diphosphokinase
MSSITEVVAYIGLGSNLVKPRQQVEQALRELDELGGCYLLSRSSLYRSRPIGPQDQPDFINAVAAILTCLEAEALLEAMQKLEQCHQRDRSALRWGPRTLDLDLLLYGDQLINTQRLRVPHPEITQRAFVLVPLKEIADPDLYIPEVGTLKEIMPSIVTQDVERIT